MMQIEDRLDALLTMRLQRSPQFHGGWVSEDDELMPLLQVADALVPLRTATPTDAFTRSLEQRLLVYDASLAAIAHEHPSTDEVIHAQDDEFRSVVAMDLQPRERPQRYARQETSARKKHWRPWQVVAAAMFLLVTGMAALTAASAAAGPGSFLFGLHRAEQNVRLQLAPSQGDRIRLHLSYADEALSQLNNVTTHEAGDAAYSAALETFMAERQAVARDLASLPAGEEHDKLSVQLSTLTTRARSSLHVALALISWPNRVATTQALGELGEPILAVTDIKITHENGQNVHLVRIVAEGSGFTAGSVIAVNGRAVGSVISATATQIIVEIDAASLRLPPHDIGVSNPDGTAAVSPHFEIDNASDHGRSDGSHPTPVVTPHSH